MIKKVILSMLVLFTLVGCSSSKTKEIEMKRLEEKYPTYLKESIGYLLSYDKTGKVITGFSSAFVYEKNSTTSYIIGSGSIASKDYTYKFIIDDTEIECNYIGKDEYLNVSVLSFSNKLYKSSAVNKGLSSNMKVGNSIHVSMLGSFYSHLEDNMTLSKGIISSQNVSYCINDYLFSCNNYMLIDNVAVETGQGAPVLDYYGNVIGVVSYVPYDNNNNVLSYVSPIEQVDRAVDNILKNNKYLRADLHVEIREYSKLSKDIKESIDIENIKNSDVIITKVTGYAQGAGIPLNSKVISINDDIINNKSELIDVLYKYNSGDSVELMVEVSSGVYETYTLIV